MDVIFGFRVPVDKFNRIGENNGVNDDELGSVTVDTNESWPDDVDATMDHTPV